MQAPDGHWSTLDSLQLLRTGAVWDHHQTNPGACALKADRRELCQLLIHWVFPAAGQIKRCSEKHVHTPHLHLQTQQCHNNSVSLSTCCSSWFHVRPRIPRPYRSLVRVLMYFPHSQTATLITFVKLGWHPHYESKILSKRTKATHLLVKPTCRSSTLQSVVWCLVRSIHVLLHGIVVQPVDQPPPWENFWKTESWNIHTCIKSISYCILRSSSVRSEPLHVKDCPTIWHNIPTGAQQQQNYETHMYAQILARTIALHSSEWWSICFVGRRCTRVLELQRASSSYPSKPHVLRTVWVRKG